MLQNGVSLQIHGGLLPPRASNTNVQIGDAAIEGDNKPLFLRKLADLLEKSKSGKAVILKNLLFNLFQSCCRNLNCLLVLNTLRYFLLLKFYIRTIVLYTCHTLYVTFIGLEVAGSILYAKIRREFPFEVWILDEVIRKSRNTLK